MREIFADRQANTVCRFRTLLLRLSPPLSDYRQIAAVAVEAVKHFVEPGEAKHELAKEVRGEMPVGVDGYQRLTQPCHWSRVGCGDSVQDPISPVERSASKPSCAGTMSLMRLMWPPLLATAAANSRSPLPAGRGSCRENRPLVVFQDLDP